MSLLLTQDSKNRLEFTALPIDPGKETVANFYHQIKEKHH